MPVHGLPPRPFSSPPRLQRSHERNSQAGLTLVELMVAMVISSIVVFFLFSVQTRMSRAYEGQSTVSEINQNLQAAKQRLLTEMRMAGFGLALGNGQVKVATTVDATGLLAGFSVSNDTYGDGNDTFRLVYATGDEVTMLEGANNNVSATYAPAPAAPPSATLVGQPVIIASRSRACLVEITEVNPVMVKFTATPSSAPYNIVSNPQCADVRSQIGTEPVKLTRVVARTYRIDPNRDAGFLQVSPSGELVPNDFIDLGVGFTNLQIATRYFESGDLVDADGDGDPERDWYSGDNQDPTDPVHPLGSVLIQASLSVEARSPFGTRGAAASTATPAFTDLARVNNNSLGDWGVSCSGPVNPCGVDLANTPDASRPSRYRGEFIYRHSSSIVDLRNMGVGQ